MEVIEPSTLKAMTRTLCLEAIKSVPRNDLGDTLSLTAATGVCCIKQCSEIKNNESLWQNKAIEARPSLNKSLAATSFILYQALQHIEADEFKEAAGAIFEALELFGVSPRAFLPLVESAISDISPACNAILQEQQIDIAKVLKDAE